MCWSLRDSPLFLLGKASMAALLGVISDMILHADGFDQNKQCKFLTVARLLNVTDALSKKIQVTAALLQVAPARHGENS